jgi:hypothetical protein
MQCASDGWYNLKHPFLTVPFDVLCCCCCCCCRVNMYSSFYMAVRKNKSA